MNILSLFDGMSCGMLAFQKAEIAVANYYAYEIDKYAIRTATHNFPQIQECGDVFNADFTKYCGIDYLIGGSPCTYWSCAQSPDKRETTANGMGWELFSQYIRAIKESKPKYFIYENNNSMSKAIRKSITQTFGFVPICINSALVTAQNRQRLYWVGKRNTDGTYSKVDVQQPKDKGILLKDVLDCVTDRKTGVAEPVNTTLDGKSQTLKAQYIHTDVNNICCYKSTYGASGVAESVYISRCRYLDTDNRNIKIDGKTYKVYGVKDGEITIKGRQYPIKLIDGYYIIRKLTVSECKRLQTVPEWYEFPVSGTQSYKMLGNGWTIDVIVHLIEATKKN